MFSQQQCRPFAYKRDKQFYSEFPPKNARQTIVEMMILDVVWTEKNLFWYAQTMIIWHHFIQPEARPKKMKKLLYFFLMLIFREIAPYIMMIKKRGPVILIFHTKWGSWRRSWKSKDLFHSQSKRHETQKENKQREIDFSHFLCFSSLVYPGSSMMHRGTRLLWGRWCNPQTHQLLFQNLSEKTNCSFEEISLKFSPYKLLVPMLLTFLVSYPLALSFKEATDDRKLRAGCDMCCIPPMN